MNIAMLGGDARMTMLSELLAGGRHTVCAFGMLPGRGAEPAATAREALCGAELVLLPVPVSRDGVHIFAPHADRPLSLTSVLDDLPHGATLCGGSFGREVRALCCRRGICPVDLLEDEGVVLRNACLTAEGAVAAAAGRLSRALCDCRVGILGYGRIGKRLCRLLSGFDASVTVFARRPEALEAARAAGAHGRLLAEATAEDFAALQVLYNTVPADTIEKSLLGGAENLLCIELAGEHLPPPPAGHGELVRLPALPGRYAPESAALALLGGLAPYLAAP